MQTRTLLINTSESGKKHIDFAISGGRLSHAILIIGDNAVCSEIANYTASRIFAKPENKTDDISDFLHIDGKTVKIAGINELLDTMTMLPTSGKRLIEIKNAGFMSLAVQNTLLKTIEEPPIGNHFILYGNPMGLLPTIHSRCMTLDTGHISHEEAAEYIRQQGADTEDAMYYAGIALYSVENGIKLYSDEEYRSFCFECVLWFCGIKKTSLISDKLKDFALYDATATVDMAELSLSDMRRYKLGCDKVVFYREPYKSEIKEAAKRLSEKEISDISILLRDAKAQINSNAPARQVLENFAAKTEKVTGYGRHL